MTSDESHGPDAWCAAVLRRLGKFVGRHPLKWFIGHHIIVLLLCLGMLTRQIFGGKEPLTSPGNMAAQWCVDGSRTQDTVNFMDASGDAFAGWTALGSTTMFTPKDKGVKDIATREGLEVLYKVFKEAATLEVEVNNKTFTFFDLCSRGILPDIPASADRPIMPCSLIGPLMCFKEGGEVNHPSWQAMDAHLGENLSHGFPGAVPYSTRPSFRDLTDDQIKAELSVLREPSKAKLRPGIGRGCFGWSSGLTYYVDFWGGQVEWDGNMLKRVGSLRMLVAWDGFERIAYRIGVARPEAAANHEDIKQAVILMSGKWHSLAVGMTQQNDLMKVVDLEDVDEIVGPRFEHTSSSINWGMLIGGGVCMLVFTTMALVSWSHPLASRLRIGLDGVAIIGFAEIVALSIFYLSGKYLNVAMLIALPLLALGLGVDDMFVYIRYFSELGHRFITEHSDEEIIGELLARAGPGTLLSSICNVLTFAVGVFFPIEAMADFCFGAMLISIWNYYVVTNLFVPTLVPEIHRIKAGKAERHLLTWCCHRRVLARAEDKPYMTATCAAEYERSLEKLFISFLKTKYAPAIMHPVMRVLMFFLLIGLFVMSLLLIDNMPLGYGPWDIFKEGSDDNIAMEAVFRDFSLFPAQLVFRDLDVASNQAEMLKVFGKLMHTQYAVPYPIPPYPTIMSVNGSDTGKNVCDVPGHNGSGEMACDLSYTDASLAPFGLVPADRFDQKFNEWRAFPAIAPMAWAKTGMFWADTAGANEFLYENKTGVEKLSYSFFPYLVSFPFRDGASAEDLFVDSIQQTQEVLDASPIAANVVSYGSIGVFWEVFVDLTQHLHRLIGIGVAIIFVCTLVIFSFDIPTALISCVSCALIVLQLYGISANIMKFNIFVAAIVLLGMGMSVEFTAHFAASFSSQAGETDVAKRLGNSMAHTFPPLFEGAVSTLASILPLAFAKDMFTVKYLFGVIALLLLIGLFNALVVMPGLIALLSPIITALERRCGSSSKVSPGDEVIVMSTTATPPIFEDDLDLK